MTPGAEKMGRRLNLSCSRVAFAALKDYSSSYEVGQIGHG